MTRLRGWVRSHPTQADLLLAMLVFVVSLGPFLGGNSERHGAESWGDFVAVAPAACACLVVRRWYPWRVWGAVTALGLVGVALAHAPTPAYVPAMVALYSLSVRVRPSHAAGAALVSAILPVVLIVTLRPTGWFDSVAYFMTAWSGVALMAGIAVRSQRAVLEAAYARAREAEATREDEAQRRVVEERLRIARDLHDVVAHHVSVINVQAGVAGHLVRSDPDAASEALAHVREASQTVLREVPALLGLLRAGDETLETAPVPRLADAELLVEQARRSGAHVVWQTSGTQVSLPASTDMTAYRVLQEALTNATRHGTGRVLVRVDYSEDQLRLEVHNALDPSATDTDPDAAPAGRHGLVGMRERVAAIGGTLSAGPEDPHGWLVRALLPVSRPRTAAPELTPEITPVVTAEETQAVSPR